MGNADSKSALEIDISKRKSLSFDEGQFANYHNNKIKPVNTNTINHKHISSSMDIKLLSQHPNNHSIINMSPITIDNTHSVSIIEQSMMNKTMSKIDQKDKLQRLNRVNDELRKQLIEINQKLAMQLQRKKLFNTNTNNILGKKSLSDGQRQSLCSEKVSMSRHDNSRQGYNHDNTKQKDDFTIVALKKQLQNAYSQALTYKKHLSLLKSGQSSQRNIKLQQYEDRLTLLDQQINIIQKSIASTKDIVDKQELAIGQIQRGMSESGVEENKKQIVKLKQRLRDIKEKARRDQKDQKLRHELLVQMERKLRGINGQYLPDIKNWNREMPQTIKQSKLLLNKKHNINNSKLNNMNNIKLNNLNNGNQSSSNSYKQLPTLEQYQKMINQHIIAKKNYEQANRRIDQQLRKKNECSKQRKNILQQLAGIQKTIQSLKYKKERYLQSILQSIDAIENNSNG